MGFQFVGFEYDFQMFTGSYLARWNSWSGRVEVRRFDSSSFLRASTLIKYKINYIGSAGLNLVQACVNVVTELLKLNAFYARKLHNKVTCSSALEAKCLNEPLGT